MRGYTPAMPKTYRQAKFTQPRHGSDYVAMPSTLVLVEIEPGMYQLDFMEWARRPRHRRLIVPLPTFSQVFASLDVGLEHFRTMGQQLLDHGYLLVD